MPLNFLYNGLQSVWGKMLMFSRWLHSDVLFLNYASFPLNLPADYTASKKRRVVHQSCIYKYLHGKSSFHIRQKKLIFDNKYAKINFLDQDKLYTCQGGLSCILDQGIAQHTHTRQACRFRLCTFNKNKPSLCSGSCDECPCTP